MLLNEQQIEEAKKRAEEVVNGFTTIKMQQELDAISLAETIQLRNKQLANLVEEIKKRSTARSAAGGFGGDDIFGDIFDNNFFSQNPFGAGFGKKK